MPERLIERGIGEVREVLVEDGEIVEARIRREGIVSAGTILRARLAATAPQAVAIADGREYLLAKGAPGVSQGGTITIEIVRETLAGAEPWKRPLARVTDEAPRAAPPVAGRALAFPSAQDELEAAGWSDLLEEARSGIVQFAGGELRVSLTPAMTLIDVDGTLAPARLALTAAAAVGKLIRRHGVGGSIGIDFPTVTGKTERQVIGEAVDAVLPRPFERTAVNGFGFLQIVRPRRHASLFELAADRAAFEARVLLRRAARLHGAIRVTAHPAVIAEIGEGWIDALERQVGGAVTLQADPARPISGGDAQ